ncbi:MAG: hypothetical protein E7171_06815 [Firmicutes bacterium]|nr:hypothetical protein [Bacillota bacterium]
MKNYGKVTEYNGLFGNIKGVDGVDYVLLDKNLVDKNVNVLDNVEFEPEVFQTPEVEVQMARFVKSLTKEQTQQRRNK